MHLYTWRIRNVKNECMTTTTTTQLRLGSKTFCYLDASIDCDIQFSALILRIAFAQLCSLCALRYERRLFAIYLTIWPR